MWRKSIWNFSELSVLTAWLQVSKCNKFKVYWFDEKKLSNWFKRNQNCWFGVYWRFIERKILYALSWTMIHGIFISWPSKISMDFLCKNGFASSNCAQIKAIFLNYRRGIRTIWHSFYCSLDHHFKQVVSN